MCVGIPLQVLRMDGAMAVCLGNDGEQRIDTLLTGPLLPGQWVLSFLGAAREVLDAERAAQIGDALAGLQSILNGNGDVQSLIQTHFADLVDREPQLPAFLRPVINEGKPQ
jgi:hydrogenase expression/formation protein HypC